METLEPEESISIHAPARGATFVNAIVTYGKLFQSTPLREGRPESSNPSRADFAISIHAPARGATSHKHYTGSGTGISIHAPARGATLQ